MQIQKFSSANYFTEESVKKIEDILREAIKKHGKAFVALSGGKTPRPIYEKLAASDLDFSKVEFFLADERYTNLESDDSNYKLILETLFGGKPKEFIENENQPTLNNFHFFDTSLPIPECLQKYEEELKKIPQLEFDLIILGIGIDGHFASIFPGSPALNFNKAHDDNQLVAHTQTEQFAVRDRLTLMPNLILKAKNILTLLSGKDKVNLIQELVNGQKDANEFPAHVLTSHFQMMAHYLA